MNGTSDSGSDQQRNLRCREAALEMGAEQFRQAGHLLVDQIGDFLQTLQTAPSPSESGQPSRPVHPAESVAEVKAALGSAALPQQGMAAAALLDETAHLLFDHSLFNGHPGFMAYVTSSAAPIGALGDLLASSINANVGAWALSPMATEIEKQTVDWIRQAIDCDESYGGLLVSGGTMANFVGFLAARKAQTDWDIRSQGLGKSGQSLRLYASRETHTWLQKAADLFGLGTDAIVWIDTDDQQKIDSHDLQGKIAADREAGLQPFLVIASAGTVSTGAIDPLEAIAEICRAQDLWFHVDGAYGAFAAMLPEASSDLRALSSADSIALDPHKWLYTPLEAGCVLVKDPKHLVDAFSFHPDYYLFDQDDQQENSEDQPINFYEYGLQNSRGFRALKVWLAWRQAGREGYIGMIRDDIALAQVLAKKVTQQEELQLCTQSLSITTFVYVPRQIPPALSEIEGREYLNDLNRELLEQVQATGQVYLSNAMIDGQFVLRACIVNFRTTLSEVEKLLQVVVDLGRALEKA
ncbi:MAG: aspartate aminotransferase family protein [Verrucomicrobiales bacterium]|nr:aspartate aminotransferase family protein [Verrucomicrobiales bacterium]